MVFVISAAISPGFPVASAKRYVQQLHGSFVINVRKHQVSVACSAKLPWAEHFHDPSKLMEHMSYTKNKLTEFIPSSVKQFPWKKAENVAVNELLVLGKETLKWSLIACFAFGFLSDLIYSISRSNELVIPFGLFVGCLLAKHLDGISQEFIPDQEDGWSIWRPVGLCCFFFVLKVISAYFSVGKGFLLHASTGGLMQVLWNWQKMPKQDGDRYLSEDVHTPNDC